MSGKDLKPARKPDEPKKTAAEIADDKVKAAVLKEADAGRKCVGGL